MGNFDNQFVDKKEALAARKYEWQSSIICFKKSFITFNEKIKVRRKRKKNILKRNFSSLSSFNHKQIEVYYFLSKFIKFRKIFSANNFIKIYHKDIFLLFYNSHFLAIWPLITMVRVFFVRVN